MLEDVSPAVTCHIQDLFKHYPVGQYHVRPGYVVYINDSTIFESAVDHANIAQEEIRHRDSEVHLRAFTTDIDPSMPSIGISSTLIDVSVTGYAAYFGADLSSSVVLPPTMPAPRIRDRKGVAVRRDADNAWGCDPYDHEYLNSILLVRRGQCTFLEKLLQARDALASGIIVISDEDTGTNPTANPEELEEVGDLSDVALILLPKKTGEAFEQMVEISEQVNDVQIMVALQPFGTSEETKSLPDDKEETMEDQTKDPNRILYINGHPLINTRLLI